MSGLGNLLVRSFFFFFFFFFRSAGRLQVIDCETLSVSLTETKVYPWESRPETRVVSMPASDRFVSCVASFPIRQILA